MTTSLARTAPEAPVARLAVRPPYLVAGAALGAAAVTLAVIWGTGVSSVLVFIVLPDVTLLLALGGQGVQQGQLPARAVPGYNLMHHPAVPAAVLALAAVGLVGGYWVVAALAWGAHIGIDRGCGYGLRTRDGWQRG